MAELEDPDSAMGRKIHAVERVVRETVDVGPLFRQATGTLAAIGAANDNARLDELLDAFRSFVLARDGELGFAERVARTRLRRTVAGRSSAAVVRVEARRLLREPS